MKKINEPNILIAITTLKKIIAIFFGPFLTAYFIKVSVDSLIDISLYNIMNYIILGVGGIIVGFIVRNKFQIGMFRLGIIFNFVYILSIIILKEQILEFLPLISFLYGISAATYFYPYNLFLANKIKNSERAEYEFKKKTISTVTAIVTPIILGSIITTTNFELTAIIILIISLIQIILSFYIKPIENKNYKFTLIKSLRKLLKNKDITNLFKVQFLQGMNVGEGALDIVITVLIFNAFKTDLNLGILSSVSSILVIIMQYIYVKKFKDKHDKLIIGICSIIPTISLILLLFFTNNITLTLYYFCYTTFINILTLILNVELFNIANSKIVKEDNLMEFWSIREAILNLGRITSYILLLIIAIINPDKYLYHLMLLFTLSIGIMSCFFLKIEKEKND